MSKVWVQAAREWSEFRRDRLSLCLAFLLPLLTMLLFSYGVRMQSHDVPVAIQDNCKSNLSRELAARIYATNLMRAPDPGEEDELSPQQLLKNGAAKAVIVIPADFEANLLRGQAAELPTFLDGTDIINARLIENAIRGACTFLLAGVGFYHPAVSVHPNLRIWFNPGLKESLFIVPGVCGIVLWMFPALLSCVACAREKEHGTIVQILVSNVSLYDVLLGKGLLYLGVGLLQSLLCLLLAFFLFGLSFSANPLVFIAAIFVFVLSSVFFGIAVGSWADSQTTAVQGVSSLGFFTCLLLSGFVYPISNIPYPLSLLSYLVPSRYFIEIARDTFERGMSGMRDCIDVLVLAVFVAGYFFASYFAWRRMQLGR